MPAKNKPETKPEKKLAPRKAPKEKTEEVLEGTIVEEPTAEEKVPETKIVKVLPDYEQLMNLADVFNKAGLFPGIENQYQAAAVIQLGQEIKLPPMTSLRTIFVIPSGKGATLCIKSEALLGLAIDKGVHLKVLSKTNKGCKLRFSRKGQEDHTEEYTYEDAKTAGLLTKNNWMKHPVNMYFSRCVKNGLQSFDARLSLGLSTVEEMEDEGLVNIMQPPSKEEEKPPEPEEEKKDQVTFTKSKEQPAAEAEPAQEEKPPDTSPAVEEAAQATLEERQIKDVVEDIKEYLKAAKVDAKLFKKWLGEELMPRKPDRKYVGIKFGNYSFSEGKLDDLKLIKENMEWAIEKFAESNTLHEAEAAKKPEDPL